MAGIEQLLKGEGTEALKSWVGGNGEAQDSPAKPESSLKDEAIEVMGKLEDGRRMMQGLYDQHPRLRSRLCNIKERFESVLEEMRRIWPEGSKQ